MLRQVNGNAITVDPYRKTKSQLSTPSKEYQVDQIIQKYIGLDRTCDTFTSSITTMFHQTLPEDKQLVVSPYKKLTERDCEKYLQTFQRLSSDRKSNRQDSPPDEMFHHLRTSSDFNSSNSSLHEIAQNLQEAFDSPQSNRNMYPEKSPEFYNPEQKLKSLPKELPIIEENDEIPNAQQRLNGLITQIDQKIGIHNPQVIEKIKEKYLPKQEIAPEFHDFPDPSDDQFDDQQIEQDDEQLDQQQLEQQEQQEQQQFEQQEQQQITQNKQINIKEFRLQAIRNITFNSNDFNDLIQEQFQPIEQKINNDEKIVQVQPKKQFEITTQQARITTKATIILLILTLIWQLFTFI